MEDFPEDLMGVMRLVSDIWFRLSMGFDILAMLRTRTSPLQGLWL
jgi:hypothetical protein